MAISSLSSRIFCGMAAVVVVCTVTMVVSISPVIENGVERALVDRLKVAHKNFDRHLVSRYDLLESRVISAVDKTELKATLGTDDLDSDAVTALARHYRKVLGVDMVVLTSPTGEILGASRDYSPEGDRIVETPALRRPLRGERYAGWFDDGRRMYLVASAPVSRRGRFVGVIIIGEAVERELLDELSDALEVSIMVMRKSSAVEWSTEDKRFDPREFAGELLKSESSTTGIRRVRNETIDRFVVVSQVSPTVQIALSSSADELAELKQRLVLWVLGFGLVAAGLGLLLSHWIARRLASPMTELALAADRVAGGDWDTIVKESSMDETARVGRAFNQITRWARQLVEDVRTKAEILQRQRNELEWANQAKNNFLINASHELRTPLTTIVSSSEILSQHGASGDEETRMEFLRMIDVEAARISSLVDQFLDVSEMEAGEIQLDFERFDFVAALRGLVEAFRSGAGDRPFSMRTHPDLGMCVGDRKRLLQVVEQLLDNIAKFTPEDSEVTIELRENDETFELRVADRGPGFKSDEERERIFERFVQGGDILTEKPTGVGLGLSIARDVARAHAGDLRCEPNPGGGSVFVLTFAARLSVVSDRA